MLLYYYYYQDGWYGVSTNEEQFDFWVLVFLY